MSTFQIRHGHLFCGSGSGARGFSRSTARVGQMRAEMVCVGGIDIDRAAINDFQRMVGVPGTVMDLASREQYIAINERQPPEDWREALPSDVRAAFTDRPNIIFTSSPCKGLSGLTSETKSLTPKYQAMNELTLRGIWLSLEAFRDDPVEFYLFENVPRISTRGRHLLDQIVSLLQHFGYAVAETTHDCGELGGLAQSRKRFLLVARHVEKVPPFLYEPARKPLRGVGEVLGRLPMPGDPAAGSLHRIPQLAWKTWVRLAFVEAGKDWRSLGRLAIENGQLRDFAIAESTNWQGGVLGVRPWHEPSGTITGRSTPTNGEFSVADPRWDAGKYDCGQYGLGRWSAPVGAVINVKSPGQGRYSVADPRLPDINPNRQNGLYRVVRYDKPSHLVTGASHAAGGAQAVADPRVEWEKRHSTHLRVGEWNHSSGAITSGGKGVQGGALSVADPRPGFLRERGDHYLTAGHYGVVDWSQTAYAVTGSLQHDNGHGSVADPRLPSADEKLACVIVAEDGTWHRPFTTLDMAALQTFFEPDEWMHFQMHGKSDSAIRERIGNAVPGDAAEAVGSVIARTLLLAAAGETFILSSEPIWVRGLIAAVQCGATQ